MNDGDLEHRRRILFTMLSVARLARGPVSGRWAGRSRGQRRRGEARSPRRPVPPTLCMFTLMVSEARPNHLFDAWRMQ